MPPPIDRNTTISPFLEKYLTKELLIQFNNPIIYDVPCGYGRHLQWLANKGYEVHGIDLDVKALNFVEEWKEQYEMKRVFISKEDIDRIKIQSCCDVMLNIHLYSKGILKVLSQMVKFNGLFVIETPEIHGENYLELPEQGEVGEYLKSQRYELMIYEESVPHKGHVSVKAIARKLA